MAPETIEQPSPEPPRPLPVEERKRIVSEALQDAYRKGRRVEWQSDFEAVVVSGRRVNHLLHLILSVFTLGLWLIVWIFLAIIGGEKRQMLTVDEAGHRSWNKVSA